MRMVFDFHLFSIISQTKCFLHFVKTSYTQLFTLGYYKSFVLISLLFNQEQRLKTMNTDVKTLIYSLYLP